MRELYDALGALGGSREDVEEAEHARVAEVFVDEMGDAHRSAGQSERDALRALAGRVDLGRMERILMYVLRRHLVAGFYRRSVLVGDRCWFVKATASDRR
jgi:hypothetical protein